MERGTSKHIVLVPFSASFWCYIDPGLVTKTGDGLWLTVENGSFGIDAVPLDEVTSTIDGTTYYFWSVEQKAVNALVQRLQYGVSLLETGYRVLKHFSCETGAYQLFGQAVLVAKDRQRHRLPQPRSFMRRIGRLLSI